MKAKAKAATSNCKGDSNSESESYFESKEKPRTKTTTPSQESVPLLNGDFDAWLIFGDNDGYGVMRDEQWTRIYTCISLK
jgi:hypothetical protein